ncbi:hypothetical protein MFLAVUS_005709 [Mucor flavus]|uniref:Fanconi anemia group D2 protein n=1 Tax=Mucor flavus TaxID=439312 RepID=A0ABP9YZI5_9FUNG
MLFQQLLKEAGCQLESSIVIFEVESVLFRRSLANKLRSQTNEIEEFNQDLQNYTEDPAVFRKCLLPSTVADHVPKTTRTSSSESLFKTLLAIDSIQPELITYLLERLPEFYDELENDNSSSCTARLILHQLRWLDYIAQPEVLTEKLVEIIQITPAVIQHELITSLPDIVNDSEHKPIVVYLKELMNENPELTVPILDALSNLTLHSENLEDVREMVLERLESAELDDLAIIVKFLLQTVTPSTIDMVVYGIRQKLDFRALGKVQSNTQVQQKKKQAPEALILESIKLGLQFHKFVCDSWLKSIVALEEQREHKVIDLLVLIILYSMTSMKKKVEAIIKKKIVQGYITSALVQETIMCHADGLLGYWGVLLSLSESLLRSCQQMNAISPCASTLYVSSFKSSDVYYRQEIIGALVTHIGSGVEAEMNVALNVLLQLVKFDVSSVAVYSVFVKGILDYLDNLNLYQIRTLFDIFSLLALTTGNSAGDGSANLWSEIQIVIRKQLSNPREKYKIIGIIACLSSVKVLGSRVLCNDQIEAGSSTVSTKGLANNALRHPMLRQATGLLELALRFSQENPNCIALIYDELAHLISEEDIDTRLQTWVKDNMTSDFTEYYVVAETDADVYMESVRDNQYIKLEPEKMMNLDEDDSEIIVKMYELFYSPDIKIKKQVIVPMSSIFNLIQSCEKKLHNGSLQDVDALFGCGVLLFKTDDIEDISPEEVEYACDMLFYTINWEILNSFMFAEEDGFRERLVSRLRNILQLEEMLGQLMRQVSTYAPLEFHTTVPVNHTSVKNSSQIISSAVSSESQEMACSEHTPGPKAVIKEHKSSTMKFKSVDDLRPYMRAFSFHLLELLKYNQDIQKESEQLTCEEINYILKDLDNKLGIKIMPPPPVFFGKKKAEDKHPTCNATMLARMDAQNLMKKVVLYLPYILQTLENLYSELQEKDIEPGRIEGSEEILLSWPDIQNSDNSLILHNMISAIASRISNRPGNSVEDELEQAFTYLSQYGDNAPQAKTALLLFNILQRLMVISENSTKLKKIALKVVNQIITAPWFDWRDIKKEIPFLIEQFIELNEDSIDILHELVNNTLPQFEEEGHLEVLPLLKDETVVQHYQAVINQTVKAFDLLKNTDEDIDVVLVFNSRIVKIFERITYYVKAKEDRVLIGILLKSGRLFIDQFTKHSIPFFTRVFKTHSSSVIAIFKDFQASTRMLQIICSHVKVLKEVALSAYVPPLKKALEIVIYQVKMLLTENRIPQSAFFMGALKHRDIRGVEISSQIPREPDYDEEDMNEEASISSEQNDDEELPVASDIEEDGLSAAEEETLRKYKKPKPSEKQPKKPITKNPKPRKIKSPLSASTSDQAIRTSSIVPSSDEEEEDEAIAVNKNTNKRKIEVIEEEDDDDIDLFDSSDEEEEEEEEKQPSPSPTPPSPTPPPPPLQTPQPSKESNGKRRRLGLGRPVKSSQKKIFNLTGRSGEDSD